MRSPDRPTTSDTAFVLSNGKVRAWIDGGLHLKAVTSFGDPVELSEEETRELIQRLSELLRQLD